MTRRGETHRAARITCVRAFGEGHGNRTRMGWVEAICLANRPDPRETTRCGCTPGTSASDGSSRASDGWRPLQTPLARRGGRIFRPSSLDRGAWPRVELAALDHLDRLGDGEGALLAAIEQVVGIEPDDSGVAHQRVTSTLHLLGGPSRDLGLWKHLGARRHVRRSARGSSGNRTHVVTV